MFTKRDLLLRSAALVALPSFGFPAAAHAQTGVTAAEARTIAKAAGRPSQKPCKENRAHQRYGGRDRHILELGKWNSRRFGMLVDTAFGELRQRLVCLFLFGEGGIKQLHRLDKAEFLRPRPKRPVAGDLIVLDGLGRGQ
jgi:hypothetical protein